MSFGSLHESTGMANFLNTNELPRSKLRGIHKGYLIQNEASFGELTPKGLKLISIREEFCVGV